MACFRIPSTGARLSAKLHVKPPDGRFNPAWACHNLPNFFQESDATRAETEGAATQKCQKKSMNSMVQRRPRYVSKKDLPGRERGECQILQSKQHSFWTATSMLNASLCHHLDALPGLQNVPCGLAAVLCSVARLLEAPPHKTCITGLACSIAHACKSPRQPSCLSMSESEAAAQQTLSGLAYAGISGPGTISTQPTLALSCDTPAYPVLSLSHWHGWGWCSHPGALPEEASRAAAQRWEPPWCDSVGLLVCAGVP